MAGDVEAFPFADPVAQLVGVRPVLDRLLRFAEVRVDRAEPRVRQREVLVELDRAPEEGDRFLVAAGIALLVAEAERLERCERRSRRLIDRLVHLFDRRQRFPEPLPHHRGGGSDGREHLFLAGRRHLLARQDVTRLAVLGRQRDGEAGAELGDVAEHDRLDPLALADLARDAGGDRRVRRPAHERQRLAHALVRDDVEEGRFLELERERLLERAVEHRVARRVAEVGDQDLVALGERLAPAAQLPEGEPGEAEEHEGSRHGRG